MADQQNEKLVERIDAVFLPVRDLGKAVDWYTDIFGLEVRWQNQRFAGLLVGKNVGFHLVEVGTILQIKIIARSTLRPKTWAWCGLSWKNAGSG